MAPEGRGRAPLGAGGTTRTLGRGGGDGDRAVRGAHRARRERPARQVGLFAGAAVLVALPVSLLGQRSVGSSPRVASLADRGRVARAHAEHERRKRVDVDAQRGRADEPGQDLHVLGRAPGAGYWALVSAPRPSSASARETTGMPSGQDNTLSSGSFARLENWSQPPSGTFPSARSSSRAPFVISLGRSGGVHASSSALNARSVSRSSREAPAITGARGLEGARGADGQVSTMRRRSRR